MRKFVVFLIVLIIVLAVGDRVVAAGVERELASEIAAATETSETPTVEVEGVPFLTQAVAGRYEEVRFTLGSFSYGGVPVEDLRGAAYGVRAPLTDVLRNRARVVADRIAVTGTIPEGTVDGFAPEGVKVAARDGRLVATGELPVAGRRVRFDAQLRVELVNGEIKVIAERIEGVPDALARLVSYTIPFKGRLPFDVKVTSVRSVPGGLEFSAESNDVPIRG